MPRPNQVFAEPVPLPNKADQFRFNEKKRERGLDWKAVDSVALKAAIIAATDSGVALMFTQAAGGIGICMRLLLGGDKREIVYAVDASDLNEYLDQVQKAFGSSAEDLRAVLTGGK